jgi:hypothetical protein
MDAKTMRSAFGAAPMDIVANRAWRRFKNA